MSDIRKGCVYNLLSDATCARGSFRCDRKHRLAAGEPSAPQEHAPTCQSWRCAWEWRTESGAGVCRLPKDADIHYVGTVDSHEFKPLPCTCAAPQEPSEIERLKAHLAQTEKELVFTSTRWRNCRTLGDAVWQALRAAEDDNPVVLIEQLQDRLAQTERDRDEARTKLAEAEQLASHAAQECVTATELLARERTRREQAEQALQAVGAQCGFPVVLNIEQLAETICKAISRRDRERDTLQRERDDLRRRVEDFWREVERSYDIEPREFFEKEAVPMGFTSPVAMAVHHMWKRDVKERDGLTIKEHAALASPSTPEPQTCEWRDISTAPKGQTVLLYRPKMAPRDRLLIRDVRDWCGPECCPHAEPTHWMPLPSPPLAL